MQALLRFARRSFKSKRVKLWFILLILEFYRGWLQVLLPHVSESIDEPAVFVSLQVRVDLFLVELSYYFFALLLLLFPL